MSSRGGSSRYCLPSNASASNGYGYMPSDSYSYADQSSYGQGQLNGYNQYPNPAKGPKKSNGQGIFWRMNSAEARRKRRVASYKIYAIQAKVKLSWNTWKKGFRFVKRKYYGLRYRWW